MIIKNIKYLLLNLLHKFNKTIIKYEKCFMLLKNTNNKKYLIDKKNLKLYIKLVVALSIILMIFSNIDLNKTLDIIRNANFAIILIVSPITYFAAVLINAERLRIILYTQGVRASTIFLALTHMRAIFLSTFFPGVIGNDIYRIYSLIKYTKHKLISFSSVLFERIIGVMSLLVLGFMSSSYLYFIVKNPVISSLELLLIETGISFATICIITVVLVKYNVVSRIELPFSFWRKIHESFSTIHKYFSSGYAVMRIFALSLLLQFNVVLWIYAIAKALHYSLTLDILCSTVPLIILVTLLPFSINGIGLQETSYAFFLVPFGLTVTEAVSFSLLTSLVRLVMCTLGGVVFFFDNDFAWHRSMPNRHEPCPISMPEASHGIPCENIEI